MMHTRSAFQKGTTLQIHLSQPDILHSAPALQWRSNFAGTIYYAGQMLKTSNNGSLGPQFREMS